MKTLVYLVVFINILFSIFCFIIGFNFAHLFIITTLGFLQGSNSLLGNIGVPLLTGGFLVVALPMLLLGGFYAYISFKLIKTKDIRWLYSVFLPLVFLLIIPLRYNSVKNSIGKADKSYTKQLNQKSITDINIKEENNSLNTRFTLSNGTAGTYLLQLRFIPKFTTTLYSLNKELVLSANQNELNVEIDNLLSSCLESESKNHICIALNNKSAGGLQSMPIVLNANLVFLKPGQSTSYYKNQTNIDSKIKKTFVLTEESTINNFNILVIK